MKTYSLTSPHWTGEVELVYNEIGFMVNFDCSQANMSQPQHQSFLEWLPRTKQDLDLLLKKTPHLKLKEVMHNVTFEMFWNRYDEKVRSSKKKAMNVWNRLSGANKAKAYNFIGRYEASISPGVSKKYAETYLHAELWNN